MKTRNGKIPFAPVVRFIVMLMILSGLLAGAGADPASAAWTDRTISGNAGTSNAVLTYSGTTSGSVTANWLGSYSITVPNGWSGTVTPSKPGYTFSPASRTYTNLSSSQYFQNYTASTLTTYTISGNAGSANATIAYTGGSTTANSSGNYSFTVTTGWSGTVTPSKTGYTFSPSSRAYSNVQANQTAQNYTAAAVNYAISGSVGTAGAGATLTYAGGSTTADGSGGYSFNVPHGWSGTVTPSKTGYAFSPPNRSYTNVAGNQANQDYTASLANVTISGNAGTGNVVLSYTDGSPKTATANSSGAYSFEVSYNWSGTVTPSKSGFFFSPATRTYVNVTANQTAQNYAAAPNAFTFASMGDAHSEVAYFTATATQMASLNPAFVLFNGDLENDGVVNADMDSMINVLKNTGLFNKTFLVRGNHDNQAPGSAALWEAYFEMPANARTLPPYARNYVSLDANSDYLNYSFEYGNSIFIGLDVPGDIDLLTTSQLNFLDARLTYAESQGLTHAFVYFHGSEYCTESVHCTCAGRTNTACTPPDLMTLFNEHPIVTATIHGHEHLLSWTHMDGTRVSGLTHSYEMFISSPSGGATYNEYVFPERLDYFYPDMAGAQGFAAISVNGPTFTYSIYKNGSTSPVWSRTFTKNNTAPTISDIADKTTDEDTATGDIPFTIGDAETNPAYLLVTVDSSNAALVPSGNIVPGGSGANRTLNITPAANQYGAATITVSVSDGTATVNDSFLLTVNSVNDAPVADPQHVSTPWQAPVDITLTGSDMENSPLAFVIVDEPSHGSLSGSGATRTYTPDAEYSGTDSFTFKANDGETDGPPATVTISVTAHAISGNTGVGGVALSYEDVIPKTVTSDGSGAYSIQVPANWSGTVTPSKTGYDFSPVSMTYANVLSDLSGQNYAAIGLTLTISGNTGSAGVTLSYTDGTPKTVTSDEVGNYSFQVPYNWSGIVTPSLSGYGFKPATRTYTNIVANQHAQNYVTTTSRVYYVDKTNPACTDTGQVGSMAVPFCTIGRGAYLATAGQIVHVLHGTYAETIFPNNSGTAENPITYWADPGVVVTGTAPGTGFGAAFGISTKSYIVVEGFTIDQTWYKGIYVDASHHITLLNNHVSRAGITSPTHPYEQGIYLRNTSYSTITGNVTDYNTCIGIRVVGGDHNLISNNISFENFSEIETDAAGIELTGSDYNTVINNVTYSNEDSGINVYYWDSENKASTYNLIIGNLTYENGDHGIDVNQSPYNIIVGNTVQGNGTVGINLEGNTAATGSFGGVVVNNILSENGTMPPAGSWGGNLRVDKNSIADANIDYNLFHRTDATVQIIWNDLGYISLAAFHAIVPTQEVHGLEGNPLFVSPVAPVLRQTGIPYNGLGIVGDYYLKPGSPAIDSANSDAPNASLTDIMGNARVDDPATPNTGAGVRVYDDRGAFEFLPLGQSLPVVSTQAVSGITTAAAVGNGSIEATGEPLPTQHGVVWSVSPDPTLADNKTTEGPVDGTGAFTSAITGLTPGTLYHVRAYATNAAGTVYGQDVTFTAYQLPAVTTQAVSDITASTATGNGNIAALGVPNPTQHGMVWSLSPNPTLSDNKTLDGPADATGAFVSAITGLTPGTLYHVRAYATNAAGTVYGNDVVFTAHQLPTVTTQAVDDIATTTATGNGNIAALGVPNPTQHGVVWSLSPNPTLSDDKTADGPVNATGAFTSSMTNLMPGTLYYVRAYATNAAGTVYGEEVAFTTLLAPTVTTQTATDITTSAATGHGNITAFGTYAPTQHGVVWSVSPNPTLADNKTTEGPVSETGAFASAITGLTPGVTYHVRAYATSAAGTSYGEDVTFTAHIVPTVTTQAVSSIGTATAVGNGTILSLGVPNPTQHGVVWSLLPNPTLANSHTADGDVIATGAFTSSITGLTPGMLYHVRAYAANAAGVAYGEDVTFTALPSVTGTTTPNADAGAGSNTPVAGKADWANPGFITADDAKYASATLSGATLSSAYLKGTDYGFAIPANAEITGIAVTIGRFESGQNVGYFDVRDSVVRLIKNGTIVGNNKAAASTEWPVGSPASALYGSPADLWGVAWTPEDINADDFGVALSVVSDVNRIAYVDYIQVSVTYTVTTIGTSTTVNCGAGTPVVDYGSSVTCVATVTRGSGAKTPTGSVAWTTNGSGDFAASPCALSGSDGSAACSVTYTPSAVGSGSHLITANYSGDPDFFSSSGSQTVTVNKKDASVTPNAASKVYGDLDPALTGTLTGFLAGDNVAATYGRVAGETVLGGPYLISAILNPGSVLGNYNITYNTASFTIVPKIASVTPDAAGKVYGDPDPILTGTLTGFLPADNVSAAYSRAAGESVPGGPYAISAALSPIEVLGNYNIVYNAADFAITAKAVTITPDDGQSKVFGAPEPTFAFTPSPALVSGDSFTGGLGRDPGEDVGTYAFTLGTLSAGPNYALTLATGHTFAIVKAAATVTLGNLTQTYDETPKPVTVTTDPAGLSVDVAYDGSPTPPTAVGSYAVTAAVNDPNYSGSASGTLVIEQATSTHSIPLTVGWNLVSFNVHPADTSIASVLASIAGNYNVVYAWDATGAHSASGNWIKYAPSAPPYTNTLTNLDETMGFWIRMTSADTLEVTGLVPVTTEIHLYTNAGGWNLVGYPSATDRSLPLVLSANGLGTDFTYVYTYRAFDLSDPWKLFKLSSPPYANDLTELLPGWGYWIRVLANHIWSVKYLP
jgi:parallel beta-helix repeat protein